MDVKMYSTNPSERKREVVCVCGVMRWPVLGGTCMTPSVLVMGKMINSVKILQQFITAKQQISDHFVYLQNSSFLQTF